jgi:hypothetical protein
MIPSALSKKLKMELNHVCGPIFRGNLCNNARNDCQCGLQFPKEGIRKVELGPTSFLSNFNKDALHDGFGKSLGVAKIHPLAEKRSILKEIHWSFHVNRYLCVRFPCHSIPRALTLHERRTQRQSFRYLETLQSCSRAEPDIHNFLALPYKAYLYFVRTASASRREVESEMLHWGVDCSRARWRPQI